VSTRKPSRSRSDFCRNGAGFLSEESGAYTIFAVIGFAMLMVFIGLVIDVGRVMNVHSQASSYADRIALAAAAELDGRPGALNRALNAARGIPDGNRLTLAGDNDNGRVDFRRLVFMSRLGNDPSNPDTRTPKFGDRVTREWRDGSFRGGVGQSRADRESRYVMVETTPERENYLFFSMLGGMAPGIDTSTTVAPQAVAGYKRELCNSAPVMVCNPFEGSPFNPGSTPITFSLQTGTWGAGNYSLIRIDSAGGLISDLLGGILRDPDPGTACFGNTVRVRSSLGLSQQVRNLLRTEINARIDDIPNGRLSVAVVNCQSNLFNLLFGRSVAVETYVKADITSQIAQNDTNVRLRLRFLNDSAPSVTDESLREYPVLAR
jgi:hypothetical protein